ncbi:amidase [Neptuniibacter sp.]|uniref:amidase n=1 Tax=Neptuniibacter sp. TaxID=1962643 RepID=UPI00260557E8|nr:amidase [Neptuniibacter sp.]MCP4596787.1 amidase [Neptuniibacter sp.]
MTKNNNKLTVAESVIAMASGRLSSEELVSDCLERIQERDNSIKAWTSVDHEKALEQARERDQLGYRLSPLHGVPVAVKDLIDTADLPTSYGSSIYKEHQPQQDAAIVQLLQKVGAVVLGKTVTTEFAYYSPGPTCNPHNVEHTPGGSSSGSAAAVADYQVPFAIGTQTVGSMIRPGSFNGIVALKPSIGTLPYSGTKSLAPSLDTLGTFSRTVGDQRLLLTALAPHLEINNCVEKPKIAICRTPFWSEASEEMQNAFIDYAEKIKQAGFDAIEYELGPDFAALADAQFDIMASEAVRCLNKEVTEHRSWMSTHILELIEHGKQVTPEREAQCRNLLARCQYKLQQLFQQYDYFVTPATPGEAPQGTHATGDPVFNRIWTFLGVPCITYPISKGSNDLPMGIQLIAPFGGDHALIDFADKLQSKTLAQ